jgi:hypothetical protein
MEVYGVITENSDISPKADIISISASVSEQLVLPTVSSLYLDIERWTLPFSESGIFLKPLLPKSPATAPKIVTPSNKKINTKGMEDSENPVQLIAKKKAALKKLNISSQAIELIPGLMPICGAKKHVSLLIGSVPHSLLLSATGADKGSWSTLVSFDEINRTPRLIPFNEHAYMNMLYEHFGS